MPYIWYVGHRGNRYPDTVPLSTLPLRYRVPRGTINGDPGDPLTPLPPLMMYPPPMDYIRSRGAGGTHIVHRGGEEYHDCKEGYGGGVPYPIYDQRE